MELKQKIEAKINNKVLQVKFDNTSYDRGLWWLFIILLFVGFVAVSSASIFTPADMKIQNDPFYFIKRDIVYIVLGIIICLISVNIPMERWEKYCTILFWFTIMLLLVVLTGIGKDTKGASRWIPLGVANFQPAELAKFTLICFLASYFTRRYDDVRSKHLSMFKPFSVMGLLGILLLCQPDLGSTVVLFVVTFGMLYMTGAKKGQFIFLAVSGVVLFLVAVIAEPYRVKRVLSFMNPFADSYGSGYQLSHSLMAFGRGEWFGEGLGNSVHKLSYLPEAHTDFVMAIVGEEFGLIGILVIIVLLGLLVFKAMKIGKDSLLLEQRFRGFFAFGISFWILFQGFVNLGVALGMLPTKGLTFPLVSYGGSSLIIMSMTIGVLLRIDYENRQLFNQQQTTKNAH